MERHEILEALTELKLYGMRASFDEIAGKGLNRHDEIFPFLASLIRAERTHRQARSISYRMSGAKFPVLKDIGKFAFIGAGAVVTKNVPDYALVVGNPSRQTGWMSEYGHKLEFDKNGQATCKESGEKYRLENNKVSKL